MATAQRWSYQMVANPTQRQTKGAAAAGRILRLSDMWLASGAWAASPAIATVRGEPAIGLPQPASPPVQKSKRRKGKKKKLRQGGASRIGAWLRGQSTSKRALNSHQPIWFRPPCWLRWRRRNQVRFACGEPRATHAAGGRRRATDLRWDFALPQRPRRGSGSRLFLRRVAPPSRMWSYRLRL